MALSSGKTELILRELLQDRPEQVVRTALAARNRGRVVPSVVVKRRSK